jgi:hypothetical protein
LPKSATTSPTNQATSSGLPPKKSSSSEYSIVTLTRKPNGDNLIDLGQDLKFHPLMTKVSVLETFDPLLSLDADDDEDEEEIYTKVKTYNDDMPDNETIYSNDSSFYEAYDPFEYLVDKTQRQVLEEEEENSFVIRHIVIICFHFGINFFFVFVVICIQRQKWIECLQNAHFGHQRMEFKILAKIN